MAKYFHKLPLSGWLINPTVWHLHNQIKQCLEIWYVNDGLGVLAAVKAFYSFVACTALAAFIDFPQQSQHAIYYISISYLSSFTSSPPFGTIPFLFHVHTPAFSLHLWEEDKSQCISQALKFLLCRNNQNNHWSVKHTRNKTEMS